MKKRYHCFLLHEAGSDIIGNFWTPVKMFLWTPLNLFRLLSKHFVALSSYATQHHLSSTMDDLQLFCICNYPAVVVAIYVV